MPGGAWTESIYSLPASVGERPQAAVTLGPEAIYGTTNANAGDVFQLTPPATSGGAWEAQPISAAGPPVIYPYDAVTIGSGGVLYGTSWEGASTFDGNGDVFMLTPPTMPGGSWTTQSIHDFYGPSEGYPPDGCGPRASVVVAESGVLYGTTSSFDGLNACTYGLGMVYSLTPPSAPGGTWTEDILYAFRQASGSPSVPGQAGLVIGLGGVLYGTTQEGGTGSPCACGAVYALKPPLSPGGVWTETTLYSFNGAPDGTNPNGGVVIGQGGVLYGTTTNGGTGTSCSLGCGTIFSLTPPVKPGTAWTKTILHSFDLTDGANPNAGVTIGKDRALYGTTSGGGANGYGTVFQLK